MNHSQQIDKMAKQIVPVNLLPVNLSSLTDKWAYQTYHCWKHLHSGALPECPTAEDFDKWKEAAKDIVEELKSLGVSKAQDKICAMMKSFFTYEFGNREFLSMYDVVDFLSDRSFYNDNKDMFRNMVHMFQYGIFRVGFNAWAVDAANEWMDERNISYGRENIMCRRRGKGFVYKLIVSRASNSISDRLQGLTERMYQEYIVVRNKRVKKFGNECDIVPYTFNHRFPGYICISKTEPVNANTTNVSFNEEYKQIIELVKHQISRGVSYKQIYDSLSAIDNHTNTGE